ncbi:MAG: adenosine deaminase, partial [Oscillospiraceae bacterium]|nr:adenosine deaminase [Oscillospiraceae bacterium]
MDICTFIDSLNCLADLHLHLDGSVSVASARRLAAIENVSLPDDDSVLKSMLMVPEDCSDLNEYLERFSLPVSLMQHRESLKAAAEDLCLTLAEKGLMYAEIRFAPQKHCEKGLTQEEVVKAVLDGIAASGFRAGLILCCMRDGSDNHAENLETVRLSYEFKNKGVCACDLAGAEALFPNENYIYVFKEAKRLGVKLTVHSGEALGAGSVRIALENGADRIGHGVRSSEDENVVRLLKEKDIPLEICPTSNINTCVVQNVSELPVRKFMEQGIRVTINTDNMSVSSTDLKNELKKTAKAFGFGVTELKKLIVNAVTASFASDTLKAEFLK